MPSYCSTDIPKGASMVRASSSFPRFEVAKTTGLLRAHSTLAYLPLLSISASFFVAASALASPSTAE